jgi:hypothetical protein
MSPEKWFTLAVAVLALAVSVLALDTSIRLYRRAKAERDRRIKGPPS